MKTLVRLLVVVPLVLIAVLLSVANRAPVQLSLDPFSADAPAVVWSAPLFAVVLLAVAVGVLLGGIAVWWSQGRYRRAARQFGRELAGMKADAAARPATVSRGVALPPSSVA